MSKTVDALRQVVADTYALIGQTHICHWNVRGPSFFSLHNAFELQYYELFVAVDEIAERIRAKRCSCPGRVEKPCGDGRHRRDQRRRVSR